MLECGFWWLVSGEKCGRCGLLDVVFWGSDGGASDEMRGFFAALRMTSKGNGNGRSSTRSTWGWGGGLGLGDDGAEADRSALAAGWGLGAGDAGAG